MTSPEACPTTVTAAARPALSRTGPFTGAQGNYGDLQTSSYYSAYPGYLPSLYQYPCFH